MPYPALVAAKAKWDRGVKDLDALEKRVRAVRKGDLYRLEIDFDRETGWHSVYARIKGMPPPGLSVLAGNMAYQCLSALNLIAWDLAVKEIGPKRVGEVFRDIAFPISAKRNDFTSLRMVKHGYVSADAIAALDGVQPYNGPHGPTGPSQHPLFHVKTLADADKHRLLAAQFGQLTLDGIVFRWDESVASNPTIEPLISQPTRFIHDDTPISRIRFETGNTEAKVNVDRQPPIDVQFSDGKTLLSTKSLRACAGAVRWTITNLTPLFPGEENPWGDPLPRPEHD